MRVNRGDVVLVDYPFTTGGAKVLPALVVQSDILRVLGSLSAATMTQIDDCLRVALGLP
jgi:mRNA-degrading endonuclease toxin of MazEF toxin-antitoxin module